MEVKIIEENKESGKIKVEIDDGTIANLLSDNLWKGKIDYATWKRGHPYLEKPVVVVKSKDPKKSLIDACEKMKDDIESLKKSFLNAVRS